MKYKNYCIKDGYRINPNPNYFHDIPAELIYQPEVYEFAYYLAERSQAKYLIDIGGGNGEKLMPFIGKYNIIAVDYGDNLKILRNNPAFHDVIECNLETDFPTFSSELLQEAIIIFSDVVEHLIEPDRVLEALSECSHKCKYLLISTPDRVKARGAGTFGPPGNPAHVREWSIDEFHTLLSHYNFNTFSIGYTINTNKHQWKNTILSIAGTEVGYKQIETKKTLAIINVFNEIDILEEVIMHLLAQGIYVKIIDNWSTDGSYELALRLSEQNNRIQVQRFPEAPNQYYEWGALLQNVEHIASACDYDWVLHHDADELRISPWKDVNLSDAISYVDALGYNAIDFTVVDFRPVTAQEKANIKYGEALHFFEFGKRNGHFVQIKGWKNSKGVRVQLAASGGHEASFPDRKIFPLKFLLKHYPLRNEQQAKKKIFKERINRFSPTEKAKGWHTQYDQITEHTRFLWNIDLLIPWNPNVFFNDCIIERLSGIGIRRK